MSKNTATAWIIGMRYRYTLLALFLAAGMWWTIEIIWPRNAAHN